MRQCGTIAENRLFGRDRWRGAEIVCERGRCLANRERRQQQGSGRRWRQWKQGQTAAGIADKARALYGDRYAEFLDRVQAYAYFPYVVAKDVRDFRDGEISVRFEGISGRIDQGAGILFNLKPNGDYLTVRANPLENNLVLWKFEKGKRSSVKWIRNTPTPTRQWHDLKVQIAGPKITAYLDGKPYLEHVLPAPVSGRIGLWSKADSHMYFDEFTVTPAD